MMSDTFVEQVGGAHYQSAYQHWDWAVDLKLPYLEGQATKYIARARHKLGLEDLRKGLSFIDKMLKCYPSERALPVAHTLLLEATQRFAKENKLTNLEYHACLNIAGWQNAVVLQAVRTLVVRLINETEAKPVSLTEENHHTERA